jgi:hypothetical protein
LLALVAAIVLIMRRSAAESDSPIVVFPPEGNDDRDATDGDDIWPAQLLSASAHEAALEKRLDDETRARVELEQRFASANEELKVLRDRLHRLERRREGAS